MLRELVILGGEAGSSELRDWASQELRGYEREVDPPQYRKVTAPLQIDGAVPGGMIRHQTISPFDLPDFSREALKGDVPLRMGVTELQHLASAHDGDLVVKLSPPGSSDLMSYMNGNEHFNGHITALYWSVSTIAIEGVLDQIRTRLAELVAELRSGLPRAQSVPSAESAANAVSVVVNGRGNSVNIVQAADGSTVNQTLPEQEPRFWRRSRIIGAAVVGCATIVGTLVAIWPTLSFG